MSDPASASPRSAPPSAWLRSRWAGWFIAGVGVVALLLVPSTYDALYGFQAGFQLHRISLIGIYIIAALAQNVLTGYAAQPSLGNAAFFGVGAYLLAWTNTDLHQPYWLGIVIAMVVCALLGLIVGGPALRISGTYLAIATLGLVLVTQSLLDLWDKTNGRQSYDLTQLPLSLGDDHTLYVFIVVIVVAVLFFVRNILQSRVGRAWVAIRDNEAAAEAFGINLTTYKLLAFVISALLTGLAGALYATWATTASSSSSSADQTIAFLAMIVVGGLGSIVGSVIGAIFVGFLPLLLQQLPAIVSAGPIRIQVTTLQSGIFGLLLLLALIFFPEGLRGIVDRAGLLMRRLLNRHIATGASEGVER